MSDIGFIGLGIMGSPMCRNLLKAGHKLVVHNLTTEPIYRMVELGAPICFRASKFHHGLSYFPDSVFQFTGAS
jgi:3-hydroxyisobutyrate dehydrogenase-like beta-hydroxyacid dehydrogenase